MGSSASKNTEGEEDGSNGGGGGQLYVSLKMENSKVEGELTPHVYGSVPLVGSWDPSNALPMLRESASMSELSFVPKYRDTPCIVEEGENRILTGGSLQGDARVALFKLEGDVIVEFRVFINADRVSPFDLAASWRAYRENLQPSTVRGIPDVSINPDPTPVEYRRLKHGVNQCADFFRADNQEGVEARTEVAALAMEDMIAWMEDGGQVGVFDATNSTRVRRNMLMQMAEGKCKIIFLETLCNDERIIERNIRLKIQQSPDYEEETDFEAGVKDFRDRLANYERVYEPVEEGSYIKMIDMVSGNGGQIQVNNISGYLPGRIVFFLVNTHLTPRPILLTRHGESMDNVRGRTGGDSVISESGKIYAKKLANFVEKRLKNEKAASIWTSTLQRTILTAGSIVGFPKVQWRALDEINSGVCDGMTYEEIKKNMPEEYESRLKDKLRYRYPRGESYLDVIQRLEPVIIELERQRAPVVVISHQAVLRALYAYFADRPLKEIPQIEMPLHTIIEIQMGVSGVQEKRYKLMD
ncbi:hypothetical protein DY000_02058117 [Brassica cretica]|uniref:CBM20 domain-containing protein n=1 Tax=Brassica cretica TaxID=69181 RepID=A0ABQ7AIL7_BRACR|nr:hypothetical protein DY000_02058117 [Brassica cretica]